ncbi:HAD family hydrolase [Fulvimarina sp. MAC3]|uniref:HAD family hydrolase n=1 Tax=Fulvimarina sp. MAC3 TaxID=3148887 RepID=UPI0031FBE76E
MAGNFITTVGFDADDTLWHSEKHFQLTEERFRGLLDAHADGAFVSNRLLEIEKRNLGRYGFGVKGFVLSMIETALEMTEGRIETQAISEILAMGHDMLTHPVELLTNVSETLEGLAGDYRLVLITKGDLFDQERKLAASGLGDLFQAVEIVSEKTADVYRRIFTAHGDGSERSVMVGNSLKSDILPALDAGACAVHVPHDLTWAHELADSPAGVMEDRFRSIETLAELPDLLSRFGCRR